MHFQRTEALWMLHLYNRKYSSKSNFFMTNPLHSIRMWCCRRRKISKIGSIMVQVSWHANYMLCLNVISIGHVCLRQVNYAPLEFHRRLLTCFILIDLPIWLF